MLKLLVAGVMGGKEKGISPVLHFWLSVDFIVQNFFLKMQNLELKDPALVRIRGKIGILSKFEFYPMSEMYNCLLEFYWNFAVSVQKLFFL